MTQRHPNTRSRVLAAALKADAAPTDVLTARSFAGNGLSSPRLERARMAGIQTLTVSRSMMSSTALRVDQGKLDMPSRQGLELPHEHFAGTTSGHRMRLRGG